MRLVTAYIRLKAREVITVTLFNRLDNLIVSLLITSLLYTGGFLLIILLSGSRLFRLYKKTILVWNIFSGILYTLLSFLRYNSKVTEAKVKIIKVLFVREHKELAIIHKYIKEYHLTYK